MFVKVTNEDGTESFVEASAEDMDAVVQQSPKYKAVVEESIKRKEKLRALEAQKPPAEKEPVVAEAAPPAPAVDPDQITQQVMQKVLDALATQNAKEAERKQAIDNAIKTHSLPDKPEVRAILGQVQDPNIMAEQLSKAGLQLAVPFGGVPLDTPKDTVNLILQKARGK
jgi:hypothetical protein